MKHTATLLILLLLLIQSLFGQNKTNFKVTQYTTADGLATDYSKVIVQDKLGFIWVGSDLGVARFDGVGAQDYLKDLPSAYVKNVTVDKEGLVYVLSDLGLSIFDSQYDSARLLGTIEAAKTFEEDKLNWPKDMFIDSKKRIWVAGAFISRIEDRKITKHYMFDSPHDASVVARSITIVEDKEGVVWAFSLRGGVFYYNENEDKFIQVYQLQDVGNLFDVLVDKNKGGFWVAGKHLFYIAFDKDYNIVEETIPINTKSKDWSSLTYGAEGNIFASSSFHGVYFFEPSNLEGTIEKLKGIKTDKVFNIIYDHGGDYWVATVEGIFHIQKTLFAPLEGISGFVSEMEVYRDSLLVTNNGNDIVAYDITSDVPSKGDTLMVIGEVIKRDGSWTPNSMTVRKGKLWVVDSGQIVTMDLKSRKVQYVLKVEGAPGRIQIDNTGRLWFQYYDDSILYSLNMENKKTVQHPFQRSMKLLKQIRNGRFIAGSGVKSTLLFEYLIDKNEFKSIPVRYKTEDIEVNDVTEDKDNNLWLATSEGIACLKAGTDTLQFLDLGEEMNGKVFRSVGITENGLIWGGSVQGVINYDLRDNTTNIFTKKLGIVSPTATYNTMLSSGNKIFTASVNGVSYGQNLKVLSQVSEPPYFTTLNMAGELTADFSPKELISGSYLIAYVNSMNYPATDVEYQYRLNENDEWSVPTFKSEYTLHNVEDGSYKLQVRARKKGGYQWSEVRTFEFTVVPPWYKTYKAYFMYLLALALLIWGSVRWNARMLLKKQERLEKIIADRTEELREKQAEILAQNEELHQQAEEITAQRDALEQRQLKITESLEVIREKNELITSSIEYAQTIQQAVLPSDAVVDDMLNNYFLIYKPKDIVSGDFYWMLMVENKKYVAVVDCTGHGVPGAFMSIIGSSLLTKIVKDKQIYEPAAVLEELDRQVRQVLKQQESRNDDGMDLVLCCLEEAGKQVKVTYSGAKNALYYSSKGEGVKELKADRRAIGGILKKETPFTNQELLLDKGDRLFMVTDGVIDQNNAERKRFGKLHFKEVLDESLEGSIAEQRQFIISSLDEHQKKEKQRDDITILGMEI